MSTHTFGRTTLIGGVPTICKEKAQPILKEHGVELKLGRDGIQDVYWFEYTDASADANPRKEHAVEAALRAADLWPLHKPGSEPEPEWKPMN